MTRPIPIKPPAPTPTPTSSPTSGSATRSCVVATTCRSTTSSTVTTAALGTRSMPRPTRGGRVARGRSDGTAAAGLAGSGALVLLCRAIVRGSAASVGSAPVALPLATDQPLVDALLRPLLDMVHKHQCCVQSIFRLGTDHERKRSTTSAPAETTGNDTESRHRGRSTGGRRHRHGIPGGGWGGHRARGSRHRWVAPQDSAPIRTLHDTRQWVVEGQFHIHWSRVALIILSPHCRGRNAFHGTGTALCWGVLVTSYALAT